LDGEEYSEVCRQHQKKKDEMEDEESDCGAGLALFGKEEVDWQNQSAQPGSQKSD
jgi:hypothetical protein